MKRSTIKAILFFLIASAVNVNVNAVRKYVIAKKANAALIEMEKKGIKLEKSIATESEENITGIAVDNKNEFYYCIQECSKVISSSILTKINVQNNEKVSLPYFALGSANYENARLTLDEHNNFLIVSYTTCPDPRNFVSIFSMSDGDTFELIDELELGDCSSTAVIGNYVFCRDKNNSHVINVFKIEDEKTLTAVKNIDTCHHIDAFVIKDNYLFCFFYEKQELVVWDISNKNKPKYVKIFSTKELVVQNKTSEFIYEPVIAATDKFIFFGSKDKIVVLNISDVEKITVADTLDVSIFGDCLTALTIKNGRLIAAFGRKMLVFDISKYITALS